MSRDGLHGLFKSFMDDGSDWYDWFNTYFGEARHPLIDACREAIIDDDEAWFDRALLTATKPSSDGGPLGCSRLLNAIVNTKLADSRIDHVRLHHATTLALATADAARLLRRTGRRLEDAESGGRHLGDANAIRWRSALVAAERSRQASMLPTSIVGHWIREWLDGEPDRAGGPVVHVPLALVVRGERVGHLTELVLSLVDGTGTSARLVPDLAAGLTPTNADLIGALSEIEPLLPGHDVIWRIRREDHVEHRLIPFIGGTSLQAAVALGIERLARQQPYPNVVVSATICAGGRLGRVEGERPKLLGLKTLIDRARQVGNDALRKVPQRVLLAPSGDADYMKREFRELQISTPETLPQASLALDVPDDSSERFVIDRSVRRFTAMLPPNIGDDWLVSVPSQTASTFSDGCTEMMHFRNDDRVDHRHEIQFALRNSCDKPYTMHYRTEAPGAVITADCEPRWADLTVEPVRQDYRNKRQAFSYMFCPQAGQTYALSAEVYGGYRKGNRNVHAHLWPNASYEEAVMELDLTCFVDRESPWRLTEDETRWPTLRVWRITEAERKAGLMVKCEDVCKRSGQLNPLTDSLEVPRPGFWRWTIRGIVDGGALWLEWEDTIELR